jgi:hypothetical protein
MLVLAMRRQTIEITFLPAKIRIYRISCLIPHCKLAVMQFKPKRQR